MTALPYLIRNVVISGWLVYPFTQIDLFSVIWKIPKGVADYDAREIQVWGRGYTDVTRFEMPVRKWLPGWFQGLAGSDRLFVTAAVISVFLLLLYAAGMAFRWWHRRWDLLLVQGTVAASFLFWLCTSPLIRYGCVWVYLTFAVVLGGIYETVTSYEDGRKEETGKGGLQWRRMVKRAALTLTILLLLYKGLALGREIVRTHENAYWLAQKDYENYETLAYEIEGVTFYYPVEGDQVGYDSFPSSPAKVEISFLGEGLADGFIVKEPGL